MEAGQSGDSGHQLLKPWINEDALLGRTPHTIAGTVSTGAARTGAMPQDSAPGRTQQAGTGTGKILAGAACAGSLSQIPGGAHATRSKTASIGVTALGQDARKVDTLHRH